VKPFIPQLYTVKGLLSNPSSFPEFYRSTNSLIISVIFAFATSVLVYLISEITGNLSQVDRLWSVIPVFYSLHFLLYGWIHGLVSPRLFMSSGLLILWGVRLTFNYARKGGYKRGSEDYRWAIVRTWMSPLLFQLFKIFFIAIFQNILLLSITTPVYIILLNGSNTPLYWADILAVQVIIISLGIEAVADEQQWLYQQAKIYGDTMKQYTPEALERGFPAEGVWAFSRHPNFLGEQGVWFGFYLLGCAASKQLFNWTAIGWISYVALFQGSTYLTEKLSSSKYPLYKEYQRKVGKFIPVSSRRWSLRSLELKTK